MGILDDLEKKRRDTEIIPPPKGHAISEILRDKTNSDLFGKLLEMHGETELGRKVYKGTLEGDDILALSAYREKFSEKIERSEKIEKIVTKENIIEIARNSPEFAKIIDIVTPEQAVKIIREQLRKKCFEDEDMFEIISDSIKECADYKNGEYRENEKEIEKICESMNISTKEYFDAVTIKDPKEKKAALRELVRGNSSNLKNFFNKISRKNRERNKLLEKAEGLLKKSISDLDSLREDMGKVLSFSLITDEDMRNALSKELLSEHTPEEVEKRVGFSEGKEMTSIDERKLDNDWEGYKTTEDYASKSDPEKDIIKDNFLRKQRKEYKEKYKGRQGYWASVFATFLEENINNKRATLA